MQQLELDQGRTCLNELWKKVLALGIPRDGIQRQTTGIILNLIPVFEKHNDGKWREHTPNTPVPSPAPTKSNNPFLPYKEEWQSMRPNSK